MTLNTLKALEARHLGKQFLFWLGEQISLRCFATVPILLTGLFLFAGNDSLLAAEYTTHGVSMSFPTVNLSKCTDLGVITLKNISLVIQSRTTAKLTATFSATGIPFEATYSQIGNISGSTFEFPAQGMTICNTDNKWTMLHANFVLTTALDASIAAGRLTFATSDAESGSGFTDILLDFQPDIAPYIVLSESRNVYCNTEEIVILAYGDSPSSGVIRINGIETELIASDESFSYSSSLAIFYDLPDLDNQNVVIDFLTLMGNSSITINIAAPLSESMVLSTNKTLPLCNSEPIALSINNPLGSTLIWPEGGPTITNPTSKEYSVIVQKQLNGENVCPGVTKSIKIEIFNFVPTINESGPITKCQGEPVTLSAAPSGDFSYTWNLGTATAGTGSSIEATETGSYTVTVAPTSVQCPPKTSAPISVNFEAPIADAKISTPDNKTAICGAPEQPSLELTAMPNNLTYSWTRDGKDLGLTSQKITVTQGGKYEVLLIKGGCTTSENIEIADNNFDPNIADSPLAYCTDSPVTLSAKADNYALYDYSWKQGGKDIGTNSHTLTLPAQAGTFKYTVEIVAKNSGCKEKTSQEVTIKSDQAIVNATITPNPAIICNKTEGLTLTAVADSSAGISFVWTGNGNADTDKSKFVVYAAGTYSVTFQRGACKETKSVSPREEILAVNLSKPANSPVLLCTGENNVPVELKAESNLSTATIKWYRQNGSDAPGNNTGSIYIPTESGTYYAAAQFNTCTAKSTETISTELLAAFSATITPDNIAAFCEDKTVTLEAKSSQSSQASRLEYTWSQDEKVVKTAPGSKGSSLMTGKNVKYTGNTLADQIEAEFTVTVAIDGCKATSPVKTVSIKPSRTSIIVLDRNTLEATESIDNVYQWYHKKDITASVTDTVGNYLPVPGATSRILMGADSGMYYVRANRNGCGVKNSLAYAVDLVTSINPAEEKEWKVYPNPAFGAITVEQVMHNITPASIELRNTGGQLLRKNRQFKSIDNYSLDDLPPGVYFLEIRQGNRIVNKKFVKQ